MIEIEKYLFFDRTMDQINTLYHCLHRAPEHFDVINLSFDNVIKKILTNNNCHLIEEMDSSSSRLLKSSNPTLRQDACRVRTE